MLTSDIKVDHKVSNTEELPQTHQAPSGDDTDSVDEQALAFVENNDEEIILEPVGQNPYDVSYTCLLLPKHGSHYLMGDIADRLHAVLKQICISYGWYLEFLSIKPDYLQWAIRVHPSTSTSYAMQVVRKQTSLQIFEEFPRFKRENQSDDFWAPGYLIFWGSQPHPVDVVQRYIRLTRRQQGISMNE